MHFRRPTCGHDFSSLFLHFSLKLGHTHKTLKRDRWWRLWCFHLPDIAYMKFLCLISYLYVYIQINLIFCRDTHTPVFIEDNFFIFWESFWRDLSLKRDLLALGVAWRAHAVAFLLLLLFNDWTLEEKDFFLGFHYYV